MADQGETIRLGKRCFVGNLAWKTSWQDLKDKFREAGNVVYTNVMRDDDGEPPPYSLQSQRWPKCRLADLLRLFCKSQPTRCSFAQHTPVGGVCAALDQRPNCSFAMRIPYMTGPHLPTGRSKGWGIVEFETPEEVSTRGRHRAAISATDNTGKTLSVTKLRSLLQDSQYSTLDRRQATQPLLLCPQQICGPWKRLGRIAVEPIATNPTVMIFGWFLTPFGGALQREVLTAAAQSELR